MTQKSEEENEEETKKCGDEVCLPEEVKIKYFPTGSNLPTYDVLPLFEFEEYKKKIAKELSFLENPEYAAKWMEFQQGLPHTSRNLTPPALKTGKIEVFFNYRKQKVPQNYYETFIAPSSPQAVFNRK